jgi:phage gp29-like protein
VRDLAEFLEIYGLPLRLGTYPRGASQEEKSTLLRAVMSIGHDAAGIIPEGMMIDFKEAAKGDNVPFSYLIEWAERTESKAILGATLTSQTDAGSGAFALGSVHMEVMRDLVASDCRQMQRTLTQHLIYPLAALNFPDATPTRAPRFVFDLHEAEDLQTFAAALPQLVAIGLPIPVRWAQEKLAIPQPQDGEAVLGSAMGAAPARPGLEALRSRIAALQADPREDLPAAQALRLAREGQAPLDAIIEQIRALLDRGDSLEQIRDALLEVYAELDLGAIGAILEQALTAAHLAGRHDATQD